MNRYFPIYHGLVAGAPWGVACECPDGTPKAELLVLCRTEEEAAHHAKLVSRNTKGTTPEPKGTAGK